MPAAGQQRARAGMFGASKPGFWSEIGNQVRAAGEGALDTTTFGLDDQVAAGARAVGDWFHGRPIGAAYRRRIAEQHQRDADDMRRYGTARTVGTVAATALELLTPGGTLGAAARLAGKAKYLKQASKLADAITDVGQTVAPVTKRIKQVTAMGRKEAAVAMTAGGGLSGVLGQGISDIAHRRLSSGRDYAGAFAGGTVESLALLKGRPRFAAGLGGATGSITQDLLNGRVPSISDAAKAAQASHAVAHVAGAVAAGRAARASIKTKEALGETGSKLRTLANLDWTTSTKKQRYALDAIPGRFSPGYTLPDQYTAARKLIESKFGNSARLTYRQRQAQELLGPQFRVDHFGPADVGSLTGFLASQPVHEINDYSPNASNARFVLQPFR